MGCRMRKSRTEEVQEHGRILARVLADELLKNRVTGAVGPTTVATMVDKDITNGDTDNDGPHQPPPEI